MWSAPHNQITHELVERSRMQQWASPDVVQLLPPNGDRIFRFSGCCLESSPSCRTLSNDELWPTVLCSSPKCSNWLQPGRSGALKFVTLLGQETITESWLRRRIFTATFQARTSIEHVRTHSMGDLCVCVNFSSPRVPCAVGNSHSTVAPSSQSDTSNNPVCGISNIKINVEPSTQSDNGQAPNSTPGAHLPICQRPEERPSLQLQLKTP